MSQIGDDFLRQTYGNADDPTGETPSPHAVIRASAGAGKTYQLTTRYLRLLRAGALPPTILATTFTRKAAGEILQRVLGRLAKACDSEAERAALQRDLGGYPLSSAQCMAMLRHLVQTLHKLAISTIDSFFNRAAGALRFELGLPADPRLTDEGSPLSRRLRLDAIQALLGDAAATDTGFQTLIELLRRLHHDTAQRSVTDAIDDIAASLHEVYRQYPDAALWGNVDYARPLNRETLALVLESLEAAESMLPTTKAGKVRHHWSNAYPAICASLRVNDYDALLAHTLIQNVSLRDGDGASGKYDGFEFDDAWLAILRPIKLHAAASVVHELLDQTRATYELLHGFHEQYDWLRREQRVLLFSDLTHLLAQYAPADDQQAFLSELYYRLDAQVTHLLLDEFQDTSLDQWKVIRGFASEVAAVGDGQRSLFCVGDVKQAIYGWRGGCAELFTQVEQLPGLDEQSLSTLARSYRSSQVVLDAVNRVFDDLPSNVALAGAGDAAQSWSGYFTHHEAAKDLPGHVVLHSTRPGDGGAASDEDADDDDETLGVGGDPHWVYTAAYIRDLYKSMPGRSIGVLLRRRKSAAPLLHELRRLGVNVSEEGGNPIDNAPAVAAVLSAIRLADHPADSAAAFHVFNSPLGEVLGLQSRRDTEVARVALATRRALLDHGYSGVIAQWAKALAPSCDERSLRRLTQLVDLAEQYDADAGLRPGEFVQAARAAKVEDPSAAPVRVMTIHAAKGLEFDAVVLPELHARLSANDHRAMLLIDRPTPLDEPTNIMRRPNNSLAAVIPGLQDAMDRTANEQRREDLSLLYVAMTRPRYGLHLLVPPAKLDKQGKVSKAGVSDLSYAAILRQAFGVEDESAGGDAVLYEAGDGGWSGSTDSDADAAASKPSVAPPAPIAIKLARPGRAGPARSWAEASPSALHGGGSVEAADLLGLRESGGRDWGNAMHALYEQVGFFDEQPVPDDTALTHALRLAVPKADAKAAIAAFRRQLTHPAIAEALGRHGAADLWRERSFIVPVAGRLLRGQFDRVLVWRDAAGRPTRARLLDYKTDRVDDDTLDDRVEHYRGQIDAYRGALATMLGLEPSAVEAALIFVGDGRVVSVDAR